MVDNKSFFKWDKIIKITSDIFIFRRGKYVYKACNIRNIKWIREIAFLKRAEHAVKSFNLGKVLKSVDVVQLDSYKFVKHCSYVVCDDAPVVQGEVIEYCVLKFKYIECDNELTPHHISKNLAELIFMYAFLNFNSVVHRDIKEGNILMGRTLLCKDRVVIIDFNMATINGINNNKFTTGYYKDPILYTTIVADEKSDVWSFGIMLYQIFSGQQISLITGYRDLYSYDSMHKIVLSDPFFEADNLITRIIRECLQPYFQRMNFCDLYLSLAADGIFPKELANILNIFKTTKIKKSITIKDKQIEIFRFICQFPIYGNGKYHIKLLLDYLSSVLVMDNDYAYFSMYALFRIIYDSRQVDFNTFCTLFHAKTGKNISYDSLLENIKKMIKYSEDNVIGHMC